MSNNRIPCIITSTVASAATSAGTFVYDMRGVDRASLQLHATLAGTDTDVVTLTISNDGTHFDSFSTAKTVTFTGGGTIDALFELGSIDYVFLRVEFATPSAGTVTLIGTMYEIATLVQTL